MTDNIIHTFSVFMDLDLNATKEYNIPNMPPVAKLIKVKQVTINDASSPPAREAMYFLKSNLPVVGDGVLATFTDGPSVATPQTLFKVNSNLPNMITFSVYEMLTNKQVANVDNMLLAITFEIIQ